MIHHIRVRAGSRVDNTLPARIITCTNTIIPIWDNVTQVTVTLNTITCPKCLKALGLVNKTHTWDKHITNKLNKLLT